MFSKMLAVLNLSKISKSILLTQRFVGSLKYLVVQNPRHLHSKLYDKDAGLDAKRAANKFPQTYIYENDDNILSNKKLHKSMLETEVDLDQIEEESDIIDNDPDIFDNAPREHIPEDEGDKQEEEYISRPTLHSRKLRTKDYALIIKDHLINHRVKDAIDVLEIRMLKEDRVKPENYIYNLLISGCAKAGYTKKAFNLYTKMRQRGLKVKESTYTSLFNACALAPSREDGLTKAIRLRESLLDAGYEFNVFNYNVMIKTFGRWGDVKTAYILADEMRNKKLEMTAETYNFLLQACASDEKRGFGYCLLTWHNMLSKNIQPDYFSFHTVLRCVRDCGFGDLDTLQNVLQQILPKQPRQLPIEQKCINSAEHTLSSAKEKDNTSACTALDHSVNNNSLKVKNDDISLELPNLLASPPHLGSMVSLSTVEKPHERFLLLGALAGFLELMKSKKITPNIQMFTTMLEVIPPTNTAEKQIIQYIRKIGLKADIDFFNILIKKRAMRCDYEGGKEVISMIRIAGLRPDIVTYGVLALGCTSIVSSRELLEEMRYNGISMNIQILGAMLRQGCAHKNFPYIAEIMQISLDEEIRPNDVFLTHLHKFYIHCARAIDARHPTTKTKDFKKAHMKFCDKYRMYQEEYGIAGLKLEDAIKKLKVRPYAQYKEEVVEGIEPLKNEKLARKQKMRKYIKKIKIQNLKGDDDHTKQQLLSNEIADDKESPLQNKNDKQDDENLPCSNNPFRIEHP